MSVKKELTEVEKLRVLIPHWVEHSHSHRHDFQKWVEVAKAEGQMEAVAEIENALAKLSEAEGSLKKALEHLGGAVEGHHHHHH